MRRRTTASTQRQDRAQPRHEALAVGLGCGPVTDRQQSSRTGAAAREVSRREQKPEPRTG